MHRKSVPLAFRIAPAFVAIFAIVLFLLVRTTGPITPAKAATLPSDQPGSPAHYNTMSYHSEPAAPTSYRVALGDTLSSIAKRLGNSDLWPALWYANRSEIPNPNAIKVGQTLTLLDLPAVTSSLDTMALNAIPKPPPPPPAPAAVAYQPQPQQPTYSQPSYTPPAQPTASTSYSVGSSFQRCVIQAESGGNANVWNASGHWGLYQFSFSTWTAHGGAPGLFGNASGSYQTQIFNNTVAADGTSDWAPYDGC